MQLDNIAIIPARGGSVGLPGKNIRMLGDRPLIAYTIEAARNAACVERVFVTTDDDEIADVAEYYGAEVLRRPKALATGDVQTGEVFLYTLRQLRADYDIFPRVLTLLQPTSPFRTAQDIDQAHDKLSDEGCVMSAYQSRKFHWLMDEDNDFVPINHDPIFRVGRQWRDPAGLLYVENGALYICSSETLARYMTYRVYPFIPHLMSEECSIDVDNLADFEECERYLPTFTGAK